MYYTNFCPPPAESTVEEIIGISATEPDLALSVKDIIEKSRRGIPLQVARVMVDDLETQYNVTRDPDFDLADAYQMAQDPKLLRVMEKFNELVVKSRISSVSESPNDSEVSK